jgi:hypothetical protein
MSSKTKSGETSTEKIRMVRPVLLDIPKPPQMIFKKSILYEKLPINRPSGRYVTSMLILHFIHDHVGSGSATNHKPLQPACQSKTMLRNQAGTKVQLHDLRANREATTDEINNPAEDTKVQLQDLRANLEAITDEMMNKFDCLDGEIARLQDLDAKRAQQEAKELKDQNDLKEQVQELKTSMIRSSDKNDKLKDQNDTLKTLLVALQGEDAGKDQVFVFPMAGNKYHKSESDCGGCGSAKSLPIALSKKMAADLQYSACKRCSWSK